jgi:hypothetical protein
VKRLLGSPLIVGASCFWAGIAHAQVAPVPGPPGPGLAAENPVVRNGGDTTGRDADAARDDAIARERRRESTARHRARPATSDEVRIGSEVRDSRGARVGVIESVSANAAVLKASGGAVAVPLDAFGKDESGLLIGMSKADFDALVAEAHKPAG